MKQANYPRFTLGNELTKEQKSFFEENGFIHFKNFISKDTVAKIIQESKLVEKKWVEENREKVNGVPIKYGVDLDGSKIVQRFAFCSQFSDYLHEFMKDPRFPILFPLLGQGCIDPRIGEDEKDGMILNHYVNSENSNYTRLGWHTDSLRDVFYGKKIMPMLNVGVHLSDAAEGLGGLRIIPGSHNKGLFNILFRKKYFIDHKPDKDELGLMTEAGDLTVHDGRIWHRVAQSTITGETSRRRVIYVPFICGNYEPKNEKSSTVIYHKLSSVINIK
jgi:ectoine hydroxylase-related dioxygenase (phytanoyl-CoA dioxygenase family)